MSLTSGTATSEIKLVSASELCQLIKVCAKANVRTFKFGDIHLDFGSQEAHQPVVTNHVLDTIPDDKEIKKFSEELSVEQLRQDIDELKLSNPLAYEQFIEGEIGDVGGGET